MARRVYRLAAVALCLAVLGLSGCYDAPTPVCGFVCGPNLACPDDYRCFQGRCILEGAPTNVSCEGTDAGILGDAPIPPDANLGPRVVAQMPGSNDDDVAITTKITARFDKPVFTVDMFSFTLRTLVGIPVEGIIEMPDAQTAVFTPSAPLLEGTVYVVTLNGGITDEFGAPLPFTEWSFMTVPDLTPPGIALRTPLPDATDVKVNATISVQFTEPVTSIDQTTFTLRETETSLVSGFVAFDSVTHVATFHYDGALRPNTTYTVRLSGAITDFGGNPLPNAPVSWSFTTGADDVPPNIASRSPQSGDVNIGIGTLVDVRFDEEVIGVTSTSLTLTAPGNVAVPATVTYFTGQRIARLDPIDVLLANTTYQVTLSTGVTDAAGNPVAGAPVSWFFTTVADVTAPFISGRSPAVGATNVSASSVVTVFFNENVTGVSSATLKLAPGGGTVSYNPMTRTATLVPTSQLSTGTTYTVSILAGIQDLAGNPLAPGSWSFTTTADATPPTAMLTTPLHGATDVPTTTPIVVTFSETVQNINGATFRVSAGGVGVDGNFTSAMTNREWTYTPLSPLPANTTLTISLTSGIIDVFSNPLAPVSFSFVTAP
ncbi:MAG: Ig-like domain-containing protein [Kofleriaceae bacterium]|nr:Ig-like domain-containing protein [Kofleriaceae bacterium]